LVRPVRNDTGRANLEGKRCDYDADGKLVEKPSAGATTCPARLRIGYD